MLKCMHELVIFFVFEGFDIDIHIGCSAKTTSHKRTEQDRFFDAVFLVYSDTVIHQKRFDRIGAALIVLFFFLPPGYKFEWLHGSAFWICG